MEPAPGAEDLTKPDIVVVVFVEAGIKLERRFVEVEEAATKEVLY